MKKWWFRCVTGIMTAWFCCFWAMAMPKELVPGGCTVGIKLYSQGIVITGFEIDSSAREAGLKKGDVILAVDGKPVHTAEDLRGCLTDEELELTVQRKGKTASVRVDPEETAEGPRLGAYIRDSMAGVGTVTYYDPKSGEFGALGHGVSDTDAEMILPLEAGVVVPSGISEVKKGKRGEPGELKGEFNVHEILGQVEQNTEVGIFGKLRKPLDGSPVPTAEAGEVSTGNAVILSNVHGKEVCAYSVEILKIYPQGKDNGRNMLLQVTDERLLSQTGGIVQGMSGSPILQNGRIVGAVTHVLISDPTRGYGIFIENMLAEAENVK